MRFLVACIFIISKNAVSAIERGVNRGGYLYKVRLGSEITFSPTIGARCVETFLFPNTNGEYVARMTAETDITPCAIPNPRDLDSLRTLASKMSITADITCSSGRVNHVWLFCSMNGVAVSRRDAERLSSSWGDLPSRISCDPKEESAVIECARSVLNFLSVRKVVLGSEAMNSPSETKPTTPNIEKAEPVITTPPPAPPPEVDETVTSTVQPVTVTVIDGTQVNINEMSDEEVRLLTEVSGQNQARFGFKVLDGGVVRFTPRVGEECAEAYIFDNKYSTRDKYNAVAQTEFVPCASYPENTEINPEWSIDASVDCTDPAWISVSCSVAFSKDGPVVHMSRRAKTQAIADRRYLSARVTCGKSGPSELAECASIATDYQAIVKNIPN